MKKRAHTRLPAEIWDEQARKYKQGATCPDIARETRSSVSTVWRHLTKRGIPMMPSRKARQRAALVLCAGRKACSRCGDVFALEDFKKDKACVDGRANVCLPCHRRHINARRKGPEWRKRRLNWVRRYRSTEKGRKQMRESARRAMTRPGNRFTAGRVAAKKKGLLWTIVKTDYLVLIQKPCEYCQGALPRAGIGLDRLDNSKGYDLSNVVPCCSICNLARGDRFTPEEMRTFIGPAIRQVRLARGRQDLSLTPDFSGIRKDVCLASESPQ